MKKKTIGREIAVRAAPRWSEVRVTDSGPVEILSAKWQRIDHDDKEDHDEKEVEELAVWMAMGPPNDQLVILHQLVAPQQPCSFPNP